MGIETDSQTSQNRRGRCVPEGVYLLSLFLFPSLDKEEMT